MAARAPSTSLLASLPSTASPQLGSSPSSQSTFSAPSASAADSASASAPYCAGCISTKRCMKKDSGAASAGSSASASPYAL